MSQFLRYPHATLRQRAAPVAVVDKAVREIWAEMVAAMDAMPGYGLAAPQIGVSLCLAVVDASAARGQAVLLANPVVLHASAQLREHDEASPNLPGYSAVISRPRAVTVGFLNAEGEAEERDFVGLWATSVQHQIDHLAGKMFFDRLSRTKRDIFLRRVKSHLKKGK
ncbi:MAG: peptide deformylase [Rhodobacteraceae bacterium]|nr:peptide deformylase [Paracoccaceae bacterium]